MRLLVARCEVSYTGRLTAFLPEAVRLLMIKSDGSVLVHADSGGYRPSNWMTPPTVIEEEDGWVAVEIKRVGTIEAIEQLTRYLGFIRADPAKQRCRGILAAQSFKPQAVTLAESRGIRCVEIDLALLRGEREPELTLFG